MMKSISTLSKVTSNLNTVWPYDLEMEGTLAQRSPR